MAKKKQSKDRFDQRTKEPRSRIREISPGKVVSEAKRVVKLAADILEEEIAAGIIAAKEIEKKIIDVDEIRDQDADHVMSRYRSDAHEAIDMLMDVVSVATQQIEKISDRVVNITSAPSQSASTAANQVPVLRNEKTNKPGEELSINMQLQNESKENEMKVNLRETDLVSPSGDRILARNIRMEPEVLNLKPGEKQNVAIIVKIPRSTKSGQYSGLVQDKKIQGLQAMVSVDVTK